MEKKFKVKKIGNHWYPCIPHERGYLQPLDRKLELLLNRLDFDKSEEFTFEFEEIGVIFEGINILYFDEKDILKFLTINDDFPMRFVVNGSEFYISSHVILTLENIYNFNFHKTSYRIHIY
ncbi:MAG: hypothetical protein KBT03_10250 [Bacteroidales bacterium]|nr:hypothetical protein [Candidatus Scybalousia scybalohippi]